MEHTNQTKVYSVYSILPAVFFITCNRFNRFKIDKSSTESKQQQAAGRLVVCVAVAVSWASNSDAKVAYVVPTQ